MSDHHFSIEDAQVYGVEEAIMLHNLKFWIAKNKANRKHLHEGRTWMYNSASAFAELMPYWTEKQVRRVLDSLVSQRVIMASNFNEDSRDRTRWFALVSEANLPFGKMQYPKQEAPPPETGSSTRAGVEGSDRKQQIENGVLFPDSINTPPYPRKRKGSGKASMEEIIAFAQELGLPTNDGEYMFYLFEEGEWPKNWQMKIRRYERGGFMPSQKVSKQYPVNGTFSKPQAKLTQSPSERREQASDPNATPHHSEFKRKIPLRMSLTERRA